MTCPCIEFPLCMLSQIAVQHLTHNHTLKVEHVSSMYIIHTYVCMHVCGKVYSVNTYIANYTNKWGIACDIAR